MLCIMSSLSVHGLSFFFPHTLLAFDRATVTSGRHSRKWFVEKKW